MKVSLLDLTLLLVGLLLGGYWLYSGAVNSRDQGVVLAQIEAVHNPKATAFVEAWRDVHSSPSDKELTDLRVIAERIKADPNAAAAYTAELNRAAADKLTTAKAATWLTSKEGFALFGLLGAMVMVFCGYRIFSPR